MSLLFIFKVFAFANATALLSFLVFLLANKKNETQKVFTIFLGFLFLWSLFYLLWMMSSGSFAAYLYIPLFLFFSTFIPVGYLHFSLSLVDKLKRYNNLIFIAYSTAFVFGLLFVFSDSLIKSVEQISIFPYWPIAGDYFYVYLFFIFSFILFSFFTLWSEYVKTPDSIRKAQLKNILYAYVLGWAGGTTNYFLFYKIGILPYGNITVTFFTLFILYSIFKHGLFNIKIITSELFLIMVSVLLFIRIFIPTSSYDLVFNVVSFFLVLVAAYSLIRSYKREEALKNETEDLNKQLIALDERKNEFLNIASHQLKTPMTAILGYARLILESKQEDHKTTLAYLSAVRDLSNQMFRLINDMLNITKIEENKLTYRFETIDVNKLAYSLASNFVFRAKEKNLLYTIQINQEEEILGTRVDKTLFSQCIENVIDNAIKYTETGFVDVKVYSKDNRFYFVCQDSGLGIDKDSIPKLFTKFQRSKNAIKSGIDGTGIGLFIVKEILQSHNGDILVSSDGEGKGTTCTLWITLR